MALHKDLTGSDLHEPKGVATAAANTAYFADGAGSGTWRTVSASDIDTSTIHNLNTIYVSLPFKSVTTAGSLVFPAVANMTLTAAYAILSGPITTTDLVLTFNKNGSSSAGTITIAQAGSAKGTRGSLTPSVNNTFTSTDWIDIASSGSTGTADATIVLVFTLT